jgi:DNA-binding NtrC family response regulator
MIKVCAEGEERYVVFTLGETLEAIEEQIIQLVLENNHWNIAATAEALKMKRTTLHMRMKKRGLVRPANA